MRGNGYLFARFKRSRDWQTDKPTNRLHHKNAAYVFMDVVTRYQSRDGWEITLSQRWLNCLSHLIRAQERSANICQRIDYRICSFTVHLGRGKLRRSWLVPSNCMDPRSLPPWCSNWTLPMTVASASSEDPFSASPPLEQFSTEVKLVRCYWSSLPLVRRWSKRLFRGLPRVKYMSST